MSSRENIQAFGHENIQAIHPSTLMFTKDNHLSETGDCIVAVALNKAVADLSPEFKNKLRKSNAKLTILIKADELEERINAYGAKKLVLSHPTDIVVRKSNYICNRTLAINADKASSDFSRKFTEKLKNPKQEVKITLIVEG
jgi:hypothetical protein